jgi:hypothetical protein
LQRKAEGKEREKMKFWTQIYADKLRCTEVKVEMPVAQGNLPETLLLHFVK